MIRGAVPVDSPLAHGTFLHSAGKGYVSLGRKVEGRPPYNWHQHSYSLEELSEVRCPATSAQTTSTSPRTASTVRARWPG